MAAELESSRMKIDQSARALTESNTELEQRRRHIETILENIPTGVLSLDPERRVTHSNVAFGRMFWPNGGAPMIGSTLRRSFQRRNGGGPGTPAAPGRPHVSDGGAI